MKKPKSLNKAQRKFFIGSAILVVTIGYLIFTGVKASGTYYHTVSEVLAMGSSANTMSLRLEGKVAPGSIKSDPGNLKLDFDLVDKSSKTMPVTYKGVTPDMFKENIKVIVEGNVGKDGRFVANRLLTSCPSRYNAAKETKKSI